MFLLSLIWLIVVSYSIPESGRDSSWGVFVARRRMGMPDKTSLKFLRPNVCLQKAAFGTVLLETLGQGQTLPQEYH